MTMLVSVVEDRRFYPGFPLVPPDGGGSRVDRSRMECIRMGCHDLRLLRREGLGAPVFVTRDLLGRDVVVPVVIEGVSDRDRQHSDEGDDGEPPDIPDEGEGERCAECGEVYPRAGVLRHMNGPVAPL